MSLRNTSLMEGILSFVTLGQSETGSCGQWKIDYKKKQVWRKRACESAIQSAQDTSQFGLAFFGGMLFLGRVRWCGGANNVLPPLISPARSRFYALNFLHALGCWKLLKHGARRTVWSVVSKSRTFEGYISFYPSKIWACLEMGYTRKIARNCCVHLNILINLGGSKFWCNPMSSGIQFGLFLDFSLC